MDYREAKELLGKFYNANTTCSEEQNLYRWLCSDKCTEELFIDREIVRIYIQQYPPVEIPKDIEYKMELLIDKWADSRHQSVRKKISSKWKYMTGTAAMVSLIAGAIFYFHSSQKGVYVDTCQTPEEAYIEVQKTLSLISETMQKGVEPIIENQ